MSPHPASSTQLDSNMPAPMQIRLRVASLASAIAMAALAGCDSSTPTTNMPPPPSPVSNPSADNKLQDITHENESSNMDRIKKAGEGK
jgi:hypothetical protein